MSKGTKLPISFKMEAIKLFEDCVELRHFCLGRISVVYWGGEDYIFLTTENITPQINQGADTLLPSPTPQTQHLKSNLFEKMPHVIKKKKIAEFKISVTTLKN